MAEEEPCASIVSLLLEFNACINATDKYGYTPLCRAAECGNTNLVELLISRGAYLEHQTNRGVTPLFLAAAELKSETVTCLIEFGAKISVRCLYGLASDQNLGALKLIRSVIPDNGIVDFTGNSALHWAACDNNIASMDILLETDLGDVEATDDNGLTPLHIAARHGHIESVEYLILRGANVFAKDFRNRTPFQWAILWRKTKVAKFLNDHFVHINTS